MLNRRKFFVLIIVVLLVGVWVVPSSAQDGSQVLASDLANPRNLSFDSAGNLYVAEAGLGGAQRTSSDDAFGATSQITRITPDGESEVIVTGLISYREGNSLGAHAVQATDESLWILLGETSDFRIPFTHALVELDIETMRVKNFIDLLTLELEEDPDGNPNREANPTDFAVAPDGSIIIANAGCNCLMSWTESDGLQVAVVWGFEDDNPVPTSVEIDANGDIYVGFLTGFPFPQGEARIEKWSGGELVQTWEGLTMVTGLLVADDGTIYAVEFGESFDPATGWAPGRIVTVDENGVTPIMDGLNFPYGITQAPDGTIVATTGSFGGPDGQVIVVQ